MRKQTEVKMVGRDLPESTMAASWPRLATHTGQEILSISGPATVACASYKVLMGASPTPALALEHVDAKGKAIKVKTDEVGDLKLLRGERLRWVVAKGSPHGRVDALVEFVRETTPKISKPRRMTPWNNKH